MCGNRFFFSGSVHTKIDPKGRFVLPQVMRLGLVENGELRFALALGMNGCLAIYPLKDIEEIVDRARSKIHIPEYQKFFTPFFSTLHLTGCDALGRVVIPAPLREAADLKQEIVVAGVLNRIELWSKDVFERNMHSALADEGGFFEIIGEVFNQSDERPTDSTTKEVDNETY